MSKLLRSWLYQLLLARMLFAAIATVVVRRLTRGRAHPKWSLPYEVAVDVVRRFMNNGAREITAGTVASDSPVPRNPVNAKRVRLSWETLGGQKAEVHTPHAGAGNGALLYWHGGGYVSCSPRTHRDLITAIADSSGVRCVAPSYPLAPANPFPAATQTALEVYRALLASGVSPSQLVVAGDSAGAGLTLAMLLQLRDAGEPLPRAVVLLSPWVDLECTGASVQAHAPYDYLSPQLLERAASWYAGSESRRHPLVSPIHADLRGLPPMFVLTGELELFRSENELLVERLRAAGVHVTHEIGHNAVHVFPLLAAVSAQSRHAARRIGGFVREQVGVEPVVAVDGLPISA